MKIHVNIFGTHSDPDMSWMVSMAEQLQEHLVELIANGEEIITVQQTHCKSFDSDQGNEEQMYAEYLVVTKQPSVTHLGSVSEPMIATSRHHILKAKLGAYIAQAKKVKLPRDLMNLLEEAYEAL